MGCFTYDEYGTYAGKEYDTRTGGPYDRGTCDSYYGRAKIPHFFFGESFLSDVVDTPDMTPEDIEAYNAGYEWNERFGSKKEW